MPKQRKGERILGPYHEPQRKRWRVLTYTQAGEESRYHFESEQDANEFIKLTEAEILSEAHTVHSALEEYELYLRAKGNKESSIKHTVWAIKTIFPHAQPLWALEVKHCEKAYMDLFNSGKSVATHRGCLAQLKTYLGWCVGKGWLSKNPAIGIEGIGRRKRGKYQLTIRSARKWYKEALKQAKAGDDRAVGALMACLLGLRASEITQMRVGHVDEDQHLGDVVYIRNAKTEAGDRTIEVPSDLRPMFAARCADRDADEFLLPAHDGRAHWRDWVRKQVKRIAKDAGLAQDECKLVTAHSMRGLLASISMSRGVAAHSVQATLGHENISTTKGAYAKPGSGEDGARRKGLSVISPGQAEEIKEDSPDLGKRNLDKELG